MSSIAKPSATLTAATRIMSAGQVKDPTGVLTSIVWDENYGKGGQIFGVLPSPTVEKLLDGFRRVNVGELGRKIRNDTGLAKVVCDAGMGGGRDLVYLVQKGFNVLGVDISPEAVSLAQEYLRRVGHHHHLTAAGNLPGRGLVFVGDMETCLRTLKTPLSAITSNRAIHLLMNDDLIGEYQRLNDGGDELTAEKALKYAERILESADEKLASFAECAARLLQPDGLLCIGARSEEDFRADEMEWMLPGRVAKYKPHMNRRGNINIFLSEERFRKAFSSYFNILELTDGTEPDRVDRPTPVRIKYMLAQVKESPALVPAGKS